MCQDPFLRSLAPPLNKGPGHAFSFFPQVPFPSAGFFGPGSFFAFFSFVGIQVLELRCPLRCQAKCTPLPFCVDP